MDAIVVFVDKLSKMVCLTACCETDGALEVANHFVGTVFRSHGVPKTLLTDRDPFTSNLLREISVILGVKQAMSSAFHPQTDGQTERVNRVVEEMLRHFVQPRLDDWDTHLAMVEFAIVEQ
jgi:transposase InsO family protein